jgi:hypothetical protein
MNGRRERGGEGERREGKKKERRGRRGVEEN